ncbi:hypothetical protein SAMN05444166_2524 [Singulisphaera sp. GP187]|nr:hypothetical protein SAMN05444166_2524 [Singulisphaera sp. GP187]
MEPILIDNRYDPGQFGDLMEQRRGILAEEAMTTSSVGGRLTDEGLANVLGGAKAR